MNNQPTLFPLPARKVGFKDWQVMEGEVIYNEGATSLSNTDLLAHLTRDKEASEALMNKYHDLGTISKLSIEQLCETNGIGRTTAEINKAALEFGKRAINDKDASEPLTSAAAVYRLLREDMIDLEQEQLVVLMLNTKNVLIRKETLFVGSINCSQVYPREIMVAALKANAVGIILAHNHPSGDPTPSRGDVSITKSVVLAAQTVGISLLDHVIVARDGYASALNV